MQVTMLVFAKSKGSASGSLRKQIGDDLATRAHSILTVKFHKSHTRPKGWMKVKGKDCYGALNIEWDADCNMLIVRAVSRGRQPYELLGIFTQYLLEEHGRRIQNVTIQTP